MIDPTPLYNPYTDIVAVTNISTVRSTSILLKSYLR